MEGTGQQEGTGWMEARTRRWKTASSGVSHIGRFIGYVSNADYLYTFVRYSQSLDHIYARIKKNKRRILPGRLF